MMECRALIPPRYRLLRFLHPVVAEFGGLRGSSAVAWQRRRLLGTVAARELPSSDRSRKRVSKEERKAMVEAYVSEMMNGGKFPTTSDTKKQVGGCYYVVRGILQELEYDSKLPNMAMKDENPVARQINKVKGVSPLSSKEVYGISEVGVVLNNEVLANRTSVSNECGILADDGSSSQGEASNNSGQTKADMSIDTKNNKLSSEHDSSIVDHSAKLSEISKVGEVLDTKVLLGTTIVSNSQRISEEGVSSCQGELSNNSVETMVDMSIVTRDNEATTEHENSTLGQTAEGNGISSCHTAVDTSILNKYSAKDENLTLGQTAKVNGFSESGDILDSEVVGTTIVPSDNGISSDVCFKRQGEVSNHTDRTMVDTSIAMSYNEISAKDETSTERKAKVDGICNEDTEFPSKSGHHLEAPGASKNTKLGTVEEASSQASLSDQLTREKPQSEPQKTSLWGNLKSFASSIVSILLK